MPGFCILLERIYLYRNKTALIMKKLHWFVMAVCLAMIPGLQSCDDNDGYSIGDFTPPLWATVRVTGNAFYLDCDVWGKLWPVNIDLGYYEPVDGQRVVTVFNPLSDKYGEFDHAVKLLYLKEVLTKQVEELTPENESEFGNDPIWIKKGNIGISNGYMNIVFYQNLPGLPVKTPHRISLVRPQDAEELDAADGYIHLELRYNTYDDVTGLRKDGIVSFNLNSLEVTPETKGIKLKLNSEVAKEEVEVVFNLKQPENEGPNIENVDPSQSNLI